MSEILDYLKDFWQVTGWQEYEVGHKLEIMTLYFSVETKVSETMPSDYDSFSLKFYTQPKY